MSAAPQTASRVESSLDPFSPQFRADPFTPYAQLRAAEAPLVWLSQHSIWVVSRYDPVREVLQDWKRFSNAGGAASPTTSSQPWRPPSLILEVDPPDHGRTRKVLMQAISPARLQLLRPGFEAKAEEIIDAALAKGTLDAVPDLVSASPHRVPGRGGHEAWRRSLEHAHLWRDGVRRLRSGHAVVRI